MKTILPLVLASLSILGVSCSSSGHSYGHTAATRQNASDLKEPVVVRLERPIVRKVYLNPKQRVTAFPARTVLAGR